MQEGGAGGLGGMERTAAGAVSQHGSPQYPASPLRLQRRLQPSGKPCPELRRPAPRRSSQPKHTAGASQRILHQLAGLHAWWLVGQGNEWTRRDRRLGGWGRRQRAPSRQTVSGRPPPSGTRAPSWPSFSAATAGRDRDEWGPCQHASGKVPQQPDHVHLGVLWRHCLKIQSSGSSSETPARRNGGCPLSTWPNWLPEG